MEPNNKKSKIIKIAIIFLLILLIAVYVVYSFFVKTNANEALKAELLSNIKNNELEFFLKNELYSNIAEKMQKNNYNSSSNINLSTTMENNMFSKLDLSKFEFNYDYSKDNSANRNYTKLSARYAGNDLLTVDMLEDDNKFAVKSDEIVNKYVGIKESNFDSVSSKVLGENVDLSSAKKLKNYILDRENIELDNISGLDKYAEIITQNINAKDISKQDNVIVTLDSDQVTTTEYTVNVSSEEFATIMNSVAENVKSNTELLSCLTVSNVQNFEDTNQGKIVEYNDNENVVETSGVTNNFNTSMPIWGENTTTLNQVDSSTVTNETTNTNTANTTVTNEVQNTTVIENTVPVEETETPNNDEQNTEVPEPEQQPQETVSEEETIPQSASNTNVANDTVQEEDNLRLQGYIAVNENGEEEYSEETPEFIIGDNYKDTLDNIVGFSDSLDWKSYILTGAKANMSQEELASEIQKIILDKAEQNVSLIAKLYVANGQLVKVNFEIPETEESLDIEIVSKGDKEKYLNIVLLRGKEDKSSGSSVSIYKKVSDAVVKYKIKVNKIQNKKISQKTNINFETKGTNNSKKYTNTVDVSYSTKDGEFKVGVENSLDFDVNLDIAELNDENCLFIDNLSDSDLLATKDAIKTKTIQVLTDKNKNLNIIEVNNENSVVEQTNQPENVQTDDSGKAEAKDILIKTISNKMGEYQNNGQTLKIEDLEGLEIPGYEVNISISSNLAIITVNGYSFKLDSDFNLSDS